MQRLAITPFQLRIFWGSFISVFVMVFLQHVGIRPLDLIRPTPETVDVFESLRPEIEQPVNTFHLQRKPSLVSKAHATGEYTEAKSYLLVNLKNGEVISEKAADTEISIASLTKIMTAIVALDLAELGEYFTVSEKASKQIPTKIGTLPGEMLTLDELLSAMLLTSANDAAEVIKEGIDQKYGEAVFIRAMNEKADYLGLSKTHFTNPQGFDNAEHYSSAADIATVTAYALMNYPKFAEIVARDFQFLPEDSFHKQFDLYNWNGLLGVYPNVSGVKIGNTEDAGRTTIVVSEREGNTLMVVILGAPGILERDLWAAELLDQGFLEIANLPPMHITEEQLREKYQTWYPER